ncbi:hypothetical protein BBJ28_00006645 [Nothophytophthora sp. Chile5]|nr:hypothetical protein BBJ28_00006645 [Nothophytophthora sp. Chile5]
MARMATALGFVRKVWRLRMLRVLLTLAIYLIAVPGTLTRPVGVAASPAASVFEAEAKVNEAAEAAARHLQRNIADDEVRVLFCTACGYHQNFAQMKQYLEETYPHLVDRVYGVNYDVEPYQKVRPIYAGEHLGLLPALGVDMTLLRWALDNRVAAFVVVVGMGMAASKLTASGAFEIYFNGMFNPTWS